MSPKVVSPSQAHRKRENDVSNQTCPECLVAFKLDLSVNRLSITTMLSVNLFDKSLNIKPKMAIDS